MATLKFLKKYSYTSEVEGFEDVKVFLVDASSENDKAFFKMISENQKMGKLVQEDVLHLSKFSETIESLKPYVERIENLEIVDGEENIKVNDLTPLQNLKGNQLIAITHFIVEIMVKVQDFSSCLKKK